MKEMTEIEVTPEVHFAQLLASNQKTICDKALKKVRRWLTSQSHHDNAFTTDSLLKLWKGLYYYFYNADKALFQEEVADTISKFIHVFKRDEYSFMFIDTFFQTMAREWVCIDRYRLEKFLMLIRKFLRESFEFLKRLKWSLDSVNKFEEIMTGTVMNPVCYETIPLGLKTHITDIYMEELAKIGSEEITAEMMQHFIEPYCHVLIKSENIIFLKSVCKDIFLYLINQEADEEFCEFPMLQFDASSMQKLLMQFANQEGVARKNIKIIHDIVKKYQNYIDNVNPSEKAFTIKTTGSRIRKRHIDEAATSLIDEDVEFANEKIAFKKQRKELKTKS